MTTRETRGTNLEYVEIRLLTVSASGGSAGTKLVLKTEPNNGDTDSGSYMNVRVCNEYDDTSMSFELQELPALIDALTSMCAVLEKAAS